jgi:hypothetical protein
LVNLLHFEAWKALIFIYRTCLLLPNNTLNEDSVGEEELAKWNSKHLKNM